LFIADAQFAAVAAIHHMANGHRILDAQWSRYGGIVTSPLVCVNTTEQPLDGPGAPQVLMGGGL
jgi:hypothetical protein